MSNWIPPQYNFSVRNEYGMDEAREIFVVFHQHFPYSTLPENMKKWPTMLESEFVDYYDMTDAEAAEIRSIGAKHEQTRVWLLKEMIARIRAHDEESERQRRRNIADLQKTEKCKRRWFFRRLAWRRKQKLIKTQQNKVWIEENFEEIELPDGNKIFLGK